MTLRNFDGCRRENSETWCLKTAQFIHFSLEFCESIVEFVEDVVDNNSIKIIFESNPE